MQFCHLLIAAEKAKKCYNDMISMKNTRDSISRASLLYVPSLLLLLLLGWASVVTRFDQRANAAQAIPSSAGTTTGTCGDSILDTGEQCDNGPLNGSDPNQCRSDCTLPRCGDGIFDTLTEQCDAGQLNGTPGNTCATQCFLRFCGDGKIDIDLGEQCDDGNRVSGDGCDSVCKLEGSSSSASSVPATSSSSVATSVSSSMATSPSSVPSSVTSSSFSLSSSHAQSFVSSAVSQSSAPASSVGSLPSSSASSDPSFVLPPFEQAIVEKIVKGGKITRDERDKIPSITQELQTAQDALQSAAIAEVACRLLPSLAVLGDCHGKPADVLLALSSLDLPSLATERAIVDDVTLTLSDQYIELDSSLVEKFRAALAGNDPFAVVSAVQELTATLEPIASADTSVSARHIGTQAADILASGTVDTLVREYGVDKSALTSALHTVTQESARAAKDSFASLLQSTHALFALLRSKNIQPGQLLSAGAAQMSVPAVDEEIAQSVPAAARSAFVGNDEAEQLRIVRGLLSDNRIMTLQATPMSADDTAHIATERIAIDSAVQQIASGKHINPCAQSMRALLACTQSYVTDLEAAARSTQPWYVRAALRMQDFFGLRS